MRVFSVPVSVPFLRAVIAALVDGRLVDGFEARARPEHLAQATLYLPTRRAGRMAREIFLDVLKTDAVMLPRIVALGDIDEDELAFAEESEQYGGAAPLDIPPKLGELDRRLTLARLVAASAGKRLTDWCRINWTSIGNTRSSSCKSRGRHGRRTLRKFNGSNRRIGAIA